MINFIIGFIVIFGGLGTLFLLGASVISAGITLFDNEEFKKDKSVDNFKKVFKKVFQEEIIDELKDEDLPARIFMGVCVAIVGVIFILVLFLLGWVLKLLSALGGAITGL